MACSRIRGRGLRLLQIHRSRSASLPVPGPLQSLVSVSRRRDREGVTIKTSPFPVSRFGRPLFSSQLSSHLFNTFFCFRLLLLSTTLTQVHTPKPIIQLTSGRQTFTQTPLHNCSTHRDSQYSTSIQQQQQAITLHTNTYTTQCSRKLSPLPPWLWPVLAWSLPRPSQTATH